MTDESLKALATQYGVEGLSSGAVLLVDDEPDVVAVLRLVLEGDYVVHSASSGREALEIAVRVPIDVVVTDQRMAEMTGVQLLEKLLELKPDVAGIVLTAHADMPTLLSAINRARAFRFLRKPFESDELLRAVAQASESVYQRRALSQLLQLLSRRSRDLTSALDALKGAQEQMLHLERLGTTGRLAAGLAHDLRNIVMPFHMLESELRYSGLSPDLMETVHAGLGGFMNIVSTLETLRGFARGGRLDVKEESLDPGAVIRDAVAIARLDLEYRQRQVTTRVPEGLPPIRGDRQKLTQVLVNLVRNAVQATAANQAVLIEASVQGGDVLLSVEDEGPGVPPALRDQLFAPFVTGKGEQGMGMGLYMARLIVERHAGSILCSDRQGGGGRFEVRLPLARESLSQS